MRVSLAIAVLFAASPVTGCQPRASALANNYQAESHTNSDDLSGERADATIARVMSRMHVPGMALVVVRDGKVVKQSAYGVASLELGVPVTAATRFQIASATKVLTGTLVMQLVQDGTIALEAPVRQYLPDAPPPWESSPNNRLAAHPSRVTGLADPGDPSDEAVSAGATEKWLVMSK